MSGWRARPPSQYVETKGKSGTSWWLLLIVAVVCLALGATAGLKLRSGNSMVDPDDVKAAAKREQLAGQAAGELAALVQLDAAVGVPGEPTTYDAVLLGKERQDVCATSETGFTARGWYASGCGIQITWYLAVGNDSVKSVNAAVRARLQARRIPGAGSFKWTEKSGPLPDKLSSSHASTTDVSARGLTRFQHDVSIHFPEQDQVYRNVVTTVDLPTAYADRGGHRRVVTRISLVAQYAWAK